MNNLDQFRSENYVWQLNVTVDNWEVTLHKIARELMVKTLTLDFNSHFKDNNGNDISIDTSQSTYSLNAFRKIPGAIEILETTFIIKSNNKETSKTTISEISFLHNWEITLNGKLLSKEQWEAILVKIDWYIKLSNKQSEELKKNADDARIAEINAEIANMP